MVVSNKKDKSVKRSNLNIILFIIATLFLIGLYSIKILYKNGILVVILFAALVWLILWKLDWDKKDIFSAVGVIIAFSSLILAQNGINISLDISKNFIREAEPNLYPTHNCFSTPDGKYAENFSIFVNKGQQNTDNILIIIGIPKIIEYLSYELSLGGVKAHLPQNNNNIVSVGGTWNNVKSGEEVNLTVFYNKTQLNRLNTVERSFYYSLGTKEITENVDCAASWII